MTPEERAQWAYDDDWDGKAITRASEPDIPEDNE